MVIDDLAASGLCCFLVVLSQMGDNQEPTYDHCRFPSTAEDPFLCIEHKAVVDHPNRHPHTLDPVRSKCRRQSRQYYWDKKRRLENG
jgi:hypothetical protein